VLEEYKGLYMEQLFNRRKSHKR